MEKGKTKRLTKTSPTTEATAYLGGLFHEFHKQTEHYQGLTGQLLSLEARIELAEKTLCLTRDHLAMSIGKTECAIPNNWDKVLHSVRFVGVRLADACRILLQERKKMTQEEILNGLNNGMFRFRTNSPYREIHAALLKQSFAQKTGATYTWIGNPESQMPFRLREAKEPAMEVVSVSKAGGTK
jgi:hypothetical protein